MASYVEPSNKLDWAMPFNRTYQGPIDRSTMFDSYEDAEKYAAGNIEDPDKRQLCGNSYIGQIIQVYEDDTVSVYVIDENRELSTVGGGTSVVAVFG